VKSIFKLAIIFSILSLSAVSSKASTYDVTLINSSGASVGTGQFSITGTVSSAGQSNFVEGGLFNSLNSLDFKIGGHDFTLNNDLLPAMVTFDSGKLVGIAYAGVLGLFQFDLDTVGLGYMYVSNGIASFGTISPGVAATPLPPSWSLMLLGLGFGIAAIRRKGRTQPIKRDVIAAV
jgi:hypothetical protein